MLKESMPHRRPYYVFAANIAFLAIPTLLPDSGKINAAAAASLVSIILSLSSIIFGQLLSKKLEALAEEHIDVIVGDALFWAKTVFFTT